MEKSPENKDGRLEQGTPNIFPLAMAVGLTGFLLAGANEGGITDVQGFLIGFCAVIFLYVVLLMLEHHLRQQTKTSALSLTIPADVSITQTESEKGVTIQILVRNRTALPQGSANDDR